jgi:hypothetical protein
MEDLSHDRAHWNASRFRPDDGGGHYESYFQRANHPRRPLAFWIRYTVFSPKGRPADAVGELWAVYFDGEARRITAAKQVVPLSQCAFSQADLDVRIGRATLEEGRLEGRVASSGADIGWSLDYGSGEPPLLLLPRDRYEGGFPKAKALVGTPLALYHGFVVVNGQMVNVDGWVGSQNHNWGSRHTDRYAWGQVSGFDNARDAFLELSTARVRIGPLLTPPMTLIVLRADGHEYALNSLALSALAYGRFKPFRWNFDSRAGGIRIRGQIEAPPAAFVGLRYANPPGGHKICLNTKLAACAVRLDRPNQEPLVLRARHRAAFEILGDHEQEGVPVVA